MPVVTFLVYSRLNARATYAVQEKAKGFESVEDHS